VAGYQSGSRTGHTTTAGWRQSSTEDTSWAWPPGMAVVAAANCLQGSHILDIQSDSRSGTMTVRSRVVAAVRRRWGARVVAAAAVAARAVVVVRAAAMQQVAVKVTAATVVV